MIRHSIAFTYWWHSALIEWQCELEWHVDSYWDSVCALYSDLVLRSQVTTFFSRLQRSLLLTKRERGNFYYKTFWIFAHFIKNVFFLYIYKQLIRVPCLPIAKLDKWMCFYFHRTVTQRTRHCIKANRCDYDKDRNSEYMIFPHMQKIVFRFLLFLHRLLVCKQNIEAHIWSFQVKYAVTPVKREKTKQRVSDKSCEKSFGRHSIITLACWTAASKRNYMQPKQRYVEELHALRNTSNFTQSKSYSYCAPFVDFQLKSELNGIAINERCVSVEKLW